MESTLAQSSQTDFWIAEIREIISLHQEILEVLRTTIPKAIRIGEVLTCIKLSENKPIKYGQWTRWIETTFPFSDDSARRYMRYWENRELLKTCMDARSELTMNEADAIISLNGRNSAPGKLQQIHSPNFYSTEFKLRQTFIGRFTHYLKRRPLGQWETREINDFLDLIKGFELVVEQLQLELSTRQI